MSLKQINGVNISNQQSHMFRQSIKQKDPKPGKTQQVCRFQIYPGNNGALVKRVMLQGCDKRAKIWFDS